MKKSRSALLAALLTGSLVTFGSLVAATVRLPEIDPVVSLDVPASWGKPRRTDQSVSAASKDNQAFVLLEVVDWEKTKHNLDAPATDQMLGWLKDIGVAIDTSTSVRTQFVNNGIGWAGISWAGQSNEYGPARITSYSAGLSEGRGVVFTSCLMRRSEEKHDEIGAVLHSIKFTARR